MRRFLPLILADVRNIRRDPMLIMALAGPILLALFFRFIPPIVAEWLMQHFSFDLKAYYDLIWIFILQLVPLMLGMVSGYLMLEERDENLISLFAITPLRKSGYLFVRLFTPVLLTALFTGFVACFTGLVEINVIQFLLGFLLIAMEAPMMALFLVAFAANKVEGLALSKGAGVVVSAPLMAYLIHWPWQAIAGVFPTYWMAKVFLSERNSFEMFIYFLIGIIVHVALLWYLFRIFERRVD